MERLGHEKWVVGKLRMLVEGWRRPALHMDRLPVEESQSIEAWARYQEPGWTTESWAGMSS
jgi:hypothetical protein